MVEMEDARGRRYPIALCQDKHTLPGASPAFGMPITICWRVRAEFPSCPGGPAEGAVSVEALLTPGDPGREPGVPRLPTVKQARRHGWKPQFRVCPRRW